MARKKRKRTIETPERHFDKSGKFCVYEVFRRAKKQFIIYRVVRRNTLAVLLCKVSRAYHRDFFCIKMDMELERRGPFYLAQ
jgi:hypothetical protein